MCRPRVVHPNCLYSAYEDAAGEICGNRRKGRQKGKYLQTGGNWYEIEKE